MISEWIKVYDYVWKYYDQKRDLIYAYRFFIITFNLNNSKIFPVIGQRKESVLYKSTKQWFYWYFNKLNKTL